MTKVARKAEYKRIIDAGNPISKADKLFMWDEFGEYYYDLGWLYTHKNLKIGKHRTYENNCFFIKSKITGEWVEVGTTKLLSANPIKDRVNHTLRQLVRPQIEGFREANNGYGMHVDHVKPFWKLVTKWLIVKTKFNTLEDLEPIISEDGSQFTKNKLNKSWVTYHKKKARLQVLTKEDNLSKGGK